MTSLWNSEIKRNHQLSVQCRVSVFYTEHSSVGSLGKSVKWKLGKRAITLLFFVSATDLVTELCF